MTPSRKYPWILVALLWGVALLNYMDRQMLATMRPSMQIDIAELQSATNFGYLMAVFLWVYGFMSPISGIIADRFNRKWLIVGSLFVWSGVTCAMGYANNFQQLYWLRAIMGISEAFYIPAGLSLIADFHSSQSRSLAIGVHTSGIYMGQALGGFGATVAAAYSWQSSFFTFGMIGMLYSVLLIFFLRENRIANDTLGSKIANPVKTKSTLWKGLPILFANRSFRIILLYFAVLSLPGWAIKNWLPTLLAENLHIDMTKAGPLSTITTSASSLLGVIAGGILSDKWVQKNTKGRIYTSAIGIAFTIPSLLLIGFGNTLFHAITAAICFGFGFGMFDGNNMPILCQFVSSKTRATGYGLMNMAGIFAGALITNFLGKSMDAGHLGRDFAMLAVLVLAVLFIQLYFLNPASDGIADEVVSS